MTWRFKPEPNQPNDATKKKGSRHRQRELFVKWHDLSYWHCDWVSELQVRVEFSLFLKKFIDNYLYLIRIRINLQMEVFHPIMIRSYMRKFDVDEPPILDESFDDDEKCIDQIKDEKGDEIQLKEKYYKYVFF